MRREIAGSQTPESTLWTPDITIRPHHLWNSSHPRMALLQIEKPEELIRKERLAHLSFYDLDDFENGSGYTQDSLGNDRESFDKTMASTLIFYKQLYNIQDNSTMHLDIAPDGRCKACPIGKHCRSTNYMIQEEQYLSGDRKCVITSLSDTLRGERDCISQLAKVLNNVGYEENIDFIYKRTQHTLLDFGGKKFNTDIPPTPTQVTFKSMLVKTGALREALE